MSFANPVALVLLLTIPYFIWLGRPHLHERRRREQLSLLARLVLALCLILALAGAQVVRAADNLAVVFLLDYSDSIDATARTQAQNYIQDAMSHMAPTDQAGVVVFARNALIERAMSNSRDLGVIGSVPVATNTNIAGAIRLALAMFPANTARRIVLLSDGDQNQGDALAAAQLAQAAGVQIDVLPLPGRTGPDMAVTSVQAPDKVNPGEQFDLSVTVQSQSDGAATLTVLAAGTVINHQTVQVKTGDNHYVFTLTVNQQGFDDFQVQLAPVVPDTIYQNKELAGFTEAIGPPRVLMVTSTPDEIGALLPAITNQGLQVDVIAPTDLPDNLATIASYKAVILANVSATQLSTQRMKVIQSYVRDLGGGLVVIGGPTSYGPGGYFETPLEETLPVEMRIKDPKRIPPLLMVYVIDRSGSMAVVEPGNTVDDLELAKEAARRSFNLLNTTDRVGFIIFDDGTAHWLAPIQQVGDKQTILNELGGIQAGGGDGTLVSMQEVEQTVPPDPSSLKHIILLSDGGDDPSGLVQAAGDLYNKYGIDVSAICVGTDPSTYMRQMAQAGHGIYYDVLHAQDLPQVFSADTVLATHSYIIEKQFNATRTADSPILTGITSLPPLLGYVATSAKDTATVILTEPTYNDPILASWQYGLGRAVAFTSDASGRWAKNWVGQPQFGRFWSQAVRWTINDSDVGNQLESHVEQRGDQTVLVSEARDPNGNFLNGLNLSANVIDPSLNPQTVQLQQVAPGRYEGVFDPTKEGAYFIGVAGKAGNGSTTAAAQTLGWVLSYSAEYSLRPPDLGLLSQLTRMTNGVIVDEHPEQVFAHDLPAAQSATAIWPLLLLLATVMLPGDIALRKLSFTRRDIDKTVAWGRTRLGLDKPRAPKSASEGRFIRLQDAKIRAASHVESAPPVPGSLASPEPSTHASLTSPESAASHGEPVVAPIAGQKPGHGQATSTGEAALATRLLERRRARQTKK